MAFENQIEFRVSYFYLYFENQGLIQNSEIFINPTDTWYSSS